MNKKGFTLAEVLITLGIVGIVAALTVPAFISNKPCENKIKFQKAYTALSSITADLVDDETIYYRLPIAGGGLVNCEGLLCQGRPLAGNNPFGNIIADATPAWQKLAYLVASRMTIIEQVPNFRANTITYTTTDGTTWTFVQRGPAPLVANVTIDVNDERDANGNPAADKDNTNTTYSTNPYFAQRNNATNVPDRFIFDIDQDGGIIPQQGNNGIFERYLLRHPSQLNRRAILDDIKDTGHSLDTK